MSKEEHGRKIGISIDSRSLQLSTCICYSSISTVHSFRRNVNKPVSEQTRVKMTHLDSRDGRLITPGRGVLGLSWRRLEATHVTSTSQRPVAAAQTKRCQHCQV